MHSTGIEGDRSTPKLLNIVLIAIQSVVPAALFTGADLALAGALVTWTDPG